MESALPRFANKSILQLEPNRPVARREIVEPSCAKERTEKFPDAWVRSPKTEKEEPILAKARSEIVLPKRAYDLTDKELPIEEQSITERLQPNFANLRTESEEPSSTISKTLAQPPNFVSAKALSALPTLKY
jgi:hypothetical protein